MVFVPVIVSHSAGGNVGEGDEHVVAGLGGEVDDLLVVDDVVLQLSDGVVGDPFLKGHGSSSPAELLRTSAQLIRLLDWARGGHDRIRG